MDGLSDVLSLARLKGVVYFRRDFAAPWGMAMDAGPMAQFHLVVRGHCVLEMPGRDALPLASGDILMFPHGDPHALADKAASQKTPGMQVMEAHLAGRPIFQSDGERTTLVCGHFELDRRFDHRLFRELPPLIHLKHSDPHHLTWLETVTAAIIQEAGTARPGAGVVVNRLAEVLFVQALRGYMAEAAPPHGYLAALGDDRIGEAIRLMHGEAAAPHSLDGLARTVGMSRSAFAGRFRDLVGVTPMTYLTDWRMLKARELLELTQTPINRICEQVGYLSEAAFNRAFKRRFGENPGAVRRIARLDRPTF